MGSERMKELNRHVAWSLVDQPFCPLELFKSFKGRRGSESGEGRGEVEGEGEGEGSGCCQSVTI